MDALLIWYSACAIGFCAAVRHNTKAPDERPPHARVLPRWLADLTAHTEPLDGYQDPIFETAPMELERAKR